MPLRVYFNVACTSVLTPQKPRPRRASVTKHVTDQLVMPNALQKLPWEEMNVQLGVEYQADTRSIVPGQPERNTNQNQGQ